MQPSDESILPRSLVECVGPDSSRCGYCGKQQTSHNFGMWARRLDVHDYQNLLDAGWRRSGTYLYRPNLISTCCPAFVIRLEASRFKPSSTQKRVLKRLRRFSNTDRNLSTQPPSLPRLPGSSLVSTPGANGAVEQDVRVAGKTELAASKHGLALRQTCVDVSNAVQVALHAILEHDIDSKRFISEKVLESAMDRIKVYPARKPASKKRQNKRGIQSEEASNMPQLTSNVALSLAAAERQQFTSAVGAAASSISNCSKQTADDELDDSNVLKLKKGKGRKAAHAHQVQRQMDLASLIMKHIQLCHLSSNTDPIFDKVTVTYPGFLNFWLRPEAEREDEDMDTDFIGVADVKGGMVRAEFFPHHTDSQSVGRQVFGEVGIREMESERSDFSSNHEVMGNVRSGVRESSVPGAGRPSEARHEVGTQCILDELSEGDVFTMELIPARFEREAYEIFRKYQMSVHDELPHQCSELSYRRFLIDSPLVDSSSNGELESGYGSFHMLYRVCGKLFAVGVVDVLPRCLSSVYLFYDPEFSKLSPGVLSAVKEIEWVRRVATLCPSLRFYYMGYYIHTCAKMRYKAGYHPSEILCEETKNWIAADEAKEVLDGSNGRVLRLAPAGMEDAAEARHFKMTESEVESVTNESRFRIGFEHGQYRIVCMRTVEKYLTGRYSEQVEMMKTRIRAFVGLVGRASCQFFLHVFYIE